MAEIYNADFEDIKNDIKTFFSEDDTFNSYNFEGSATTNIIDIFSLIEQNALFYLNNTANEFFIAQSAQSKNVYKNAKKLNYFPTRKSAAQIIVTVTSTVDYTIPAFTTFSLGNLTLVLFENVILDSTNSRTAEITLHEGELVTETSIVDTTDIFTYTFLNELNTIDNDNVYVYVDVPDELGEYPESQNLWINLNTDIIETNTNSYFTTFTESTYSVQFDNGRVFNAPNINDRVRVVYLKTSGSTVNGTTGNVTSDISFLTIDSTGRVLDRGTDEESINEIKVRAPLFFSSQNRAVTVNDWDAVIKKFSKYSLYKDSSIWGGEIEYVDTLFGDNIVESPDTYTNLGKVIISTINSDNTFLDTTEVDEILNYLENFKIVGLRLRFLQPNVYRISPSVTVGLNPSLTFSQSEFQQTIDSYLDTLEAFDSTFYKSQLTGLINDQDGVLYSDLSYTTEMVVKNESYKVIRIGNEVNPNSISGLVSGLVFDDDGAGNIRYDGVNVGTINYTTGFIILNQAISIVDEFEFSFTLTSDLIAKAIRESIFDINNIFINFVFV